MRVCSFASLSLRVVLHRISRLLLLFICVLVATSHSRVITALLVFTTLFYFHIHTQLK